MAEFIFRAVGREGKIEEGVVEAPDLASAREAVKARGYLPVKIVPAARYAARRQQKLSLGEIIYFCRQFATILSAGISLMNGLDIMRRQRLTRRLKMEAERLYASLRTGRPLSELMAEARPLYPHLLVNMVAAGELSGNLEAVFSSMAAYYEREQNVRRKVMSLMIYPAILLAAACGLIFFFINFLLPELLKMLKESGAPLPLATRAVVFLATGLKEHIVEIIIVLLAAALAAGQVLKKPGAKRFFDRWLLRLPVFGPLLRAIVQARFCRALGLLLGSGVPLLQSLESLEKVIGHSEAVLGVRRAIEGLARGEPLASNLATVQFFDDLFIRFLSVGEETGELEEMLRLMANNYEQESEAGFARLTALVEPAVTVLMGVIVGGIVLSVVLPIFGLLDTLKR